MGLTTGIYILILIGTLLYFYSKRKYSYWRERNVLYPEPEFFFGNQKKVLNRTAHLSEIIGELYNKVKAQKKRYGGIYSFFSPQFVPVDLDLVKCILQKDFAHFPNHRPYFNEENDPLSAHLFNLQDKKWRNLRTKLTPTFTSGKMKMMFQTMVECTEGLQELLKKSLDADGPVEIKDVLACFTTDVIGSVAFGLEINSMKNPDSEFRKYANKIFTNNLRTRFMFILFNVLPRWLSNYIGVKIFDKDTESFYLNLVRNTVEYREQNNIFRKDFLHLLIQLKNIGKVSDEDDGKIMHKNNNTVPALTFNEMAAQVFVFYIAGFETSATTMSFALLELSQRQDIQDKVREEINRVIDKHDNNITYECIMEMEYLEKVLLETLRKHPPIGVLPRACTTNYNVPNSNLVIESRTEVSIPVFSIQRDPDHYPDPDTFDPERFNEENKAKRHPFAYLPFGEGPRTCIGLRFGKLQSKVGLCSFLRNYKVTLNEKTQLPIQYETGFISVVKGGVWLNLEPII